MKRISIMGCFKSEDNDLEKFEVTGLLCHPFEKKIRAAKRWSRREKGGRVRGGGRKIAAREFDWRNRLVNLHLGGDGGGESRSRRGDNGHNRRDIDC